MGDQSPNERRYKLWLCDACDQWAEQEPGEECEVCCEGEIVEVEVMPVPPGREGELSEYKKGELEGFKQGLAKRDEQIRAGTLPDGIAPSTQPGEGEWVESDGNEGDPFVRAAREERVAEAIYESGAPWVYGQDEDGEDVTKPWADAPEAVKALYRENARAALAVLADGAGEGR